MNWRIYRLPGSREIWHVDSGSGTAVLNVHGYQCHAPSRSVDIGGSNVPRAWIEICGGTELHLIKGIAVFGKRKWATEQIQSDSAEAIASAPILADETLDAGLE